MRLTYWIHQILKYIFNGNIHYEFFTEVVSIGLVKRRVNFILSAPLIWCFMFTVKGPFTFDLNALYTSGTHVKPEIGSLSSFHKTFLCQSHVWKKSSTEASIRQKWPCSYAYARWKRMTWSGVCVRFVVVRCVVYGMSLLACLTNSGSMKEQQQKY